MKEINHYYHKHSYFVAGMAGVAVGHPLDTVKVNQFYFMVLWKLIKIYLRYDFYVLMVQTPCQWNALPGWSMLTWYSNEIKETRERIILLYYTENATLK